MKWCTLLDMRKHVRMSVYTCVSKGMRSLAFATSFEMLLRVLLFYSGCRHGLYVFCTT
jgi:hypothetical protein